jgi:hypothetical protein
MTNLWLRAAGIEISDEAVLLELKAGPQSLLLDALVLRKSAAVRAVREGLHASEEEVDEALARFYTERDLFEDKEAADWRNSLRLDEEDLRGLIREECLARHLREHLAPDRMVQERFRSNPLAYTILEVEVFGFPTEGAAREFILSVREGEREPGRGEARRLTPSEAPEEIAAQLFSAAPGELVGPVEAEDGAQEVLRVAQRSERILDADLRESIRDEILREGVATALARDPITFLG